MKRLFKILLVLGVGFVNLWVGIVLLVLFYIFGRQDAHVDRIVQAIINSEKGSRKIVVKKHDSSVIASVVLGAVMTVVVVSGFLAIIT